MIRMRKRVFLYGCLIFTILLASCGKKDAGDFYQDGLKCMNGGSYEEAAKYFGIAIQENKDRAEYYIAYGMALVECGRYEDALSQFDAVIREKDNRIIRENNKHAYRGKGIAYLREGQYEQAYGQFEKALKIKELPNLDEDVLGYQVEVKLSMGDWEGALDAYNRLIDKNGKKAEYYMGRASVKVWLGDEEGAVKDYDESIKLKNRNYEAKLAKYLLQTSLGDTKEAEEALDGVLKIKPKDQKEKLCLAVAKYYRGDGEAMLEEFRSLAESGSAQGYYYMALIHQDKGEYQNAVDYYVKYYEENVGFLNTKFYNQIVGCYMELNKYGEALEWVKKWTDDGKGVLRKALLSNEIILYERLGDFDAAYQKANEYVLEYPDDLDMEKELVFITTRISNKLKKQLKEAAKKSGDEPSTEPTGEPDGEASPTPSSSEEPNTQASPTPKASKEPDMETSSIPSPSMEPTKKPSPNPSSSIEPKNGTSPTPVRG